MRKKLMILGLVIGGLLVLAPVTFAVDQTFTVSASVPAATGAGIIVSSVNTNTKQFTSVTGSSLSFDPMTFTPNINIYLPNHYFAIDVVATGGAGSPSANITYTESANHPNVGTTHGGLGSKATITFAKTTFVGKDQNGNDITSDALMGNHGPKKLLKNISGEAITSTETSGGWLRMYLGVNTGDVNAVPAEPAGSEVFSNADKPGSYTGTLLISATAT